MRPSGLGLDNVHRAYFITLSRGSVLQQAIGHSNCIDRIPCQVNVTRSRAGTVRWPNVPVLLVHICDCRLPLQPYAAEALRLLDKATVSPIEARGACSYISLVIGPAIASLESPGV